MRKTITLGEVAEELNLFYPDLVELLDDVGITEAGGSLPSNTIAYSVVEYLRENYAERLPLDSVKSTAIFSPGRYVHEQDMERKYDSWFDEWVEQSREEYPQVLYMFRHRIAKEGLADPISYEDFYQTIRAHCGEDHSKMNEILSRGIQWNLFEIYDAYKVSARPDGIVSQGYSDKNINVHLGQSRETIPVGEGAHQPKKDTKQWGFYFGFQEINGCFDLGGKQINEFFIDFGLKNGCDGHHVNIVFNKVKTPDGLKKEMRRKGGRRYVEMSIELLIKDNFQNVAEYAQSLLNDSSVFNKN